MIKGKTAADKAQFIVEFAANNGWTGTTKTTGNEEEGHATTVRLVRGPETVVIRYDENSCIEMPTVTHDGQVRQVRNVAAALRVVESTAEENAAVFVERATKKAAMRKAAPVKRAIGARAQKIPFTVEDDEDTIKAKVLGKKLVWTNSISGDMMEDVVKADHNRNGHFRVANGQLSFVGNYGFRSVKLSQLVAVRG